MLVMNKLGVWAENFDKTKNVSLLFLKEIDCEESQEISVHIAGADFYKIILNGRTVFWGPSRTAKDYAVLNTFTINLKAGKNLFAVLTTSYYVPNFSNVKQQPFLYMEIHGLNEIITHHDFACYEYMERIRNVQRYTIQRGFVELYQADNDAASFATRYLKEGKQIETKKVNIPSLLPEFFPLPILETVEYGEFACGGKITINEQLPVWDDRCVSQVPEVYEGFSREECYECISDTVSKFEYIPGKKEKALASRECVLFRLERNLSGFIKIKLKVEQKADVYVTFDERLLEENVFVDPFRFRCCNAMKWELEEGEYELESFDVYTLQYLQVNVTKGKVVVEEAGVLLVENKGAYNLSFEIEDYTLSAIMGAAQHTLAQNSWDYLMDCPSRERACWINDLYYSVQSAEMFYGNYDVIRSSLVNLLLDKGIQEFPKGVIPMCYPSDPLEGLYIPNAMLWFIMNLCERMKQGVLHDFSEEVVDKIYHAMKYFERYENRDGLLENLDGWIFVEWSIANDEDYVCGVNYPTNMLYYRTMLLVAETFGDIKLFDKAQNIKDKILEQSFDGMFFQDNRIREDGVLKLKGHISEACQYYAFFSGIATTETHRELFRLMVEKFGVFRNQEVLPEIGSANIITGLLMRLDLLNECGLHEQVIEEVKEMFGVMAHTTHTLWEYVNPSDSCNHAITSYGARILLRAMIGLEQYSENGIILAPDFCGKYDCSIKLPYKDRIVSVEVKEGKRTIMEVQAN